MKKRAVLLILCLATTTATFAQKGEKTNRGDKKASEGIEYLVIRAVEMNNMSPEYMNSREMNNPAYRQKMTAMMFEEVRYQFYVLAASVGQEIMREIRLAVDPSAALSAAGQYGWELESSYAVNQNGMIVHYYQLARDQK